MRRPRKHLSRPLYESLPWLYVAGGTVAVTVSYVTLSRPLSFVLGLSGILALIAGLAVWLRRRDFRELRANYADPAGLSGEQDD